MRHPASYAYLGQPERHARRSWCRAWYRTWNWNSTPDLRPSTTLNNTRINNVVNCGSATNDSCIGGLGGAFDSTKSTSYAVSIKSQWNGSQIDDEDDTGGYVYFNDDVAFQENGHVDGFPLVMDSEVWGGKNSMNAPCPI
jgi:hypothetical protein